MTVKLNKLKFLVVFFVVVGGLIFYGRYIEPDLITIQKIDVSQKVNVPALKGKKVVHLSDLHIGEFDKTHRRLLGEINQIEPDLICLTGDYIQWNGVNRGALEFLSRLNARYGVYAVLGDYDYSDSKNSCLFCHEKSSANFTRQHKVIMLRNNTRAIDIDGQPLHISGVDERYDGYPLNIEPEEQKKAASLLILSHSPLAFDKLNSYRNVFMLAGDTHGGQVLLPKWLYRIFGYDKNVKYNSGLFQKKDNYMYVTKGIGTSHIRFRLFRTPEVAVIYF